MCGYVASTLGSLLNHQEPSRVESRIRDQAISNNSQVVGLLSTMFPARPYFLTESMSISRLKMLNLQTREMIHPNMFQLALSDKVFLNVRASKCRLSFLMIQT